jgi:hypothetical protein
MAARVTVDEVKEILETTLTDPQLRAFVTAADQTVTEVLSGETLSTTQLREITRWLAAHLASIRDREVSQEKIGDAQMQYGGKFGMGLDATLYGQQVKVLDTSGRLANLGKRRTAIQVAHEVEDA